MDLEAEQEVVPEAEQDPVQVQVQVPADLVEVPVAVQVQVHTYHTPKLKALQMALLPLPDVMHQVDTTLEDTGISQFMMLTEML